MIYELVYGHEPGTNNRNADYEQPDFAKVHQQMEERKNMTLVYLWGRYQKDCNAREVKPYQCRQFCELYVRYTKKYSKLALENCCRLALGTSHISYSFIKSSIAAVAEEIGTAGFNTKLNEERNKGVFVMSPHAGDLDRLLMRSSKLAKEVHHCVLSTRAKQLGFDDP